ncbi:hypothetical protein LEMLEM_LOCUS3400 [Lemmus lemmus]
MAPGTALKLLRAAKGGFPLTRADSSSQVQAAGGFSLTLLGVIKTTRNLQLCLVLASCMN